MGADGIEPDPIIDMGQVIPGCRILFLRDPEGNIIELMENYRGVSGLASARGSSEEPS